jgi:hypothetical protein
VAIPLIEHRFCSLDRGRRILYERFVIIAVGPTVCKKKSNAKFVGSATNRAIDQVTLSTRVYVLMVNDSRAASQEILKKSDSRGVICDLGCDVFRCRPDAFTKPVKKWPVVGKTSEKRLKQMGMRIGHTGHHRAPNCRDVLVDRRHDVSRWLTLAELCDNTV